MSNLILLREKVLLFVEDDAVIRENTTSMLSVLFKKVITANDGEDGYEKYIDHSPDIILTDIKMPKKDGLELIADIRKNDASTPIILFSAHSDQKYLLKAINLVVDGYILKPTTLENIIETLSNCAKKMKNTKIEIMFKNGACYNPNTNELYVENKTLQLPQKEYVMIKLLIDAYPAILSKEELSSRIWPNESISDSAIKNIIARLREKIGADSIVATHGVGWRICIKE